MGQDATLAFRPWTHFPLAYIAAEKVQGVKRPRKQEPMDCAAKPRGPRPARCVSLNAAAIQFRYRRIENDNRRRRAGGWMRGVAG